MTIKFIADSAADLPKEIINKYNIDIFPLYVHHKNKHYKDGVEMSPGKLYNNMREGKSYKTSQVAVNDFMEKFREYAKNEESVIYLSLASELSGTFQSAVLAKQQVLEEYPDFDLTIIDSRSASMGIGLAIFNTIKDAKKGLTKEEVIDRAKFYSAHMEHIFTVDDLDYLVQGGRLNKIAGFVGGILNIKPIIEINDGKLEPFAKKKGNKRVRKKIAEIVKKRGTDISKQTLAIIHADDREAAEKLQDEIQNKTNCDSFVYSNVGAVIGVHTGPGAYGVFFINEDREINNVQIY